MSNFTEYDVLKDDACEKNYPKCTECAYRSDCKEALGFFMTTKENNK